MNCFYCFVYFVILIGCSKPQHDTETKIISDTFLSLIDTVAYTYPALIPSNPSEKNMSEPKLLVTVDQTLFNIYSLDKELTYALKKLDSSDAESLKYISLFRNNRSDTLDRTVKAEWLTSTGKYKVEYHDNSKQNYNNASIENVQFSRVLFDSSRAIIAVMVRDNIKNGVIKVAFLKKQPNGWTVLSKVPVTVF